MFLLPSMPALKWEYCLTNVAFVTVCLFVPFVTYPGNFLFYEQPINTKYTRKQDIKQMKPFNQMVIRNPRIILPTSPRIMLDLFIRIFASK